MVSEQISGWLVRAFPDDPEMRVSHETIYQSLFVQSRGALRKELTRYLRTRVPAPPGRTPEAVRNGQGQIRAASTSVNGLPKPKIVPFLDIGKATWSSAGASAPSRRSLNGTAAS